MSKKRPAFKQYFRQYQQPLQTTMAHAEREEWRRKFATNLVEFARTVNSRDALLEELHGILPHLGMPEGLVRLGSGSTRSTFGMPFALVMKPELSRACFTSLKGNVAGGFRAHASPDFAEVDRAKRFPAFVPAVYGQCLRFFERAEETINFIVSEQVIPISKFLDAATVVFDTDGANFGLDPVSGRLLLMDAGSSWRDGAEEELDAGAHPLLQFPFLRSPRWEA